MAITIEDLKSKLEDLKNLDLEKGDIDNITKLINFFGLKTDTISVNCSRVFFATVREEIESKKIAQLEFAIFSAFNYLLGDNKTFNCISAITLLKNKEEPNFNIIPKIQTNQTYKIDIVLDLLFGKHQPTFKIIHFVEFIRQKELNINQFLNKAIRAKILEWLILNEPKTINWEVDFFNQDLNDLDLNIVSILEILS